MNAYREILLTVSHTDSLYPATVTSAALERGPMKLPLDDIFKPRGNLKPNQRLVVTDKELIACLGEVLRSRHVRALTTSVFARINARRLDAAPA